MQPPRRRPEPPGCMAAVKWLPVFRRRQVGTLLIKKALGQSAVFTCALGGSANTLWTLSQGGPDSRSYRLHWTVGTWREGGRRKRKGSEQEKCSMIHGVFPASANGGSAARWAWCATYLSTRFLCSRMRCTSAAVAGPCSFWPFSISFSSCSMDWVKEAAPHKRKKRKKKWTFK